MSSLVELRAAALFCNIEASALRVRLRAVVTPSVRALARDGFGYMCAGSRKSSLTLRVTMLRSPIILGRPNHQWLSVTDTI
jgi:hypothetical protein